MDRDIKDETPVDLRREARKWRVRSNLLLALIVVALLVYGLLG